MLTRKEPIYKAAAYQNAIKLLKVYLVLKNDKSHQTGEPVFIRQQII